MDGRTLSCAALVAALSFHESPIAQQPIDSVFVDGLANPVDLAFLGADRLYVAEMRGSVRVVDHGVLLPDPLFDIGDEVCYHHDLGMTGLALDPEFEKNGRIYVTYVVDRHHLLHFGTPSYSATTNDYDAATIVRVTRYTCDPATDFTTIVPGSRHVLLGATIGDGPAITSRSHGACSLQFGRDGTLLVGTGDGAWFGDVDVGSCQDTWYQQALADGILVPATNVGAFRAQQIDSLNGKILRLDPTTGDGVASNPFFVPSQPRSARSRVWSLGLRNPSRMSLRPGSGATDPRLGRPGDMYVGDVGWQLHEELDVASVGGENFGWPLFEGMDAHRQYSAHPIANGFAPNPLPGRSCSVPFFRFQDLLQQDHGDNLFFANPCAPTTAIALTTPTFRHRLPTLDWMHETADTRVVVKKGVQIDFAQIGTPLSGVAGTPFFGNCAIGGTWHSGLTFPAGFGPSYYLADFINGWIKRLTFDGSGRLTSIQPFAVVTLPVRIVEGPDHWLYYLSYAENAVRRLGFGQNPPPEPVAAIEVAEHNGMPHVQLDGRDSADPFGEPVTIEWRVDGGAPVVATQLGAAVPSTGSPTAHEVQLTVRDAAGGERALVVPFSVDNTPPRIDRIHVDNGARFDADAPTLVPLSATVTDDEHLPAEIAWEWRTTRHDGDDCVECTVDTMPATSVTLPPVAEDGRFHAYSIDLRATDGAAAVATRRVWLFPHRAGASTGVVLTTPTGGDTALLGEEITFAAIPTGPVQRVEFRVEGELVAVATAAPWQATWRTTKAGPLVACAHAVAADRTTSCSRGTEFTVVAPARCMRRVPVATGDAHAKQYSGATSIDDPEVLLGTASEPLIAAISFADFAIPPGAVLTSAHVAFTAAATDSATTRMFVTCAASLDPPPLTATPGSLSLIDTGTAVPWWPMPWTTLESGPGQRTPNLRNVLQPLVGDPSWSGNLLLLVYGVDGLRRAISADGDPRFAPLLCIDWLPPRPIATPHAIASGDDDANETVATGVVSTTNPELRLGGDAGDEQVTALRFVLPVAPGATIESARLRFTAAAAGGDAAEWTIRAEAADDAAPFATTPFALSSRPTAPAEITWTPAEWTPDQSGPAQRSPELQTVLQQIVDRPGFAANNACVLVITGSGQRTAHSRDAHSRLAPRLELIVR